MTAAPDLTESTSREHPQRSTRPIRAGLYLRLSNDPQGTQLAVARQEKELREMCAELGWDVVEVYMDNDTSAYSGKKPRTDYERMMADVEAGTLDAIGAWHNDRLHRRSKELIHFIEVVNRHATKVAVRKGGLYDLTTPSGRLTAKIVGDVAEYESDHKAERLRSKHRQMAESGTPWASNRPYGYTSGRRETIVPQEADAIKEAARRVLGGDSLRSVVRDFRQREIPTASGKPWSTITLRAILMSAGISGRREMHAHRDPDTGKRRTLGKIVAPGAWEPIITLEDSDRLRSMLTNPARRKNGRLSEYLLTGQKGVAQCGTCGGSMVSRPRHQKGKHTVNTMLCLKTAKDYEPGHVRVVTEPVEEIVTEAVLRAVDGGALRELMKSPEDTATMTELAAIEDKLKMLTRDWMSDAISRSEYEEGRQIANARKRDLELILERSRRSLGLAGLPDGPLRAAWPDMPMYKRRAVVNALVEAVVIAPPTRRGGQPGGQRGSEFDSGRVTMRWRA